MTTVFMGLSGGVDSAVSAALLKERGYDVTGVFIKIWQPEFIECSWREDRLDAMRVATALSIPFREVDFSAEYQREVVRMIADYAEGTTPNPDVLCNTSIKFGHFLNWALSEGADMISTGHYARIVNKRIENREKGIENTEKLSGYELQRGRDANKDQSYFLWQLGQTELERAMFPIGELTKDEVRRRAKKYSLPNADKPDSQGLCFVGAVTLKDFLSRFITLTKGAVLDMQGKVIGEHDGVALYTTGQRHGFRVYSGALAAHYVVRTNVRDNTLTVSTEKLDAFVSEMRVDKIGWVQDAPTFPFEAEVQTRYRERPIRAYTMNTAEGLRVRFSAPHLASAGQSLVLYDGERVLGGGVIRRT